MSSLARRACYKCGNVGHYAEVCSSAERLCYNCKQPGHESNQCPLPRTTEAKQCYHCQGLGHVQADCPTLRLSGTANRCYNCGQPGHLAVSLILVLPSMGTIRFSDLVTARLPQPRRCWSGSRSPCRTRWLWWLWTRWLWRCSPACDLLQVRWTKPLCPGLPGSGHEVLCLRKARSHLEGLPGSQRRPSEHCWQDLLPVRRGRSHLA